MHYESSKFGNSSSLVLSFYSLIYFLAERIFHDVFTFDDITLGLILHISCTE